MVIRFSDHAVRRMFQWRVSVEDVQATLTGGELLESYPDDIPYPSRLMLGWTLDGPLHVVAATAPDGAEIIITAYRPDPNEWDTTFRERRDR